MKALPLIPRYALESNSWKQICPTPSNRSTNSPMNWPACAACLANPAFRFDPSSGFPLLFLVQQFPL
ncbi:MAG: hypothetical protein EBU36_02900 [Verrucomicrobia bacterium]|nr:hypothetical protein [Verrucomicrobiota bacterium]